MPAPNTPAQLVKLREAETFRLLNHHHGCFRYIDADFNHGGGDEKFGFSRSKILHRLVALAWAHLAVNKADIFSKTLFQKLEPLFRGGKVNEFGFIHQRTNPVGARTIVDRAPDRFDHFFQPVQRNRARVDGLTARGFFAQFGNIHVAEISEHQRARNRRRGHDQEINRFALGSERQPLMHTEAMLFIDDGESQIAKFHAFLKQRMGADQEIDFARFEFFEQCVARSAALAASQDRNTNACCFRERRDTREMLTAENFRRRHDRRLMARLDHIGGGEQRHQSFPRADIALQKPKHSCVGRKIGGNFLDGLTL